VGSIGVRPAPLEFLRAGLKGCAMWAQSRYTSMRINGPARPLRVPTSSIASSRRTTRQVDHVSHSEPLAHVPQFRSRGRKVAAQQPAAVELLHAPISGLSAATHPLKDPGQFRRDCSLSVAKESSVVIEHLNIAPQREALHHAFAGRIQATAVFDWTKPQRIFQSGRGFATSMARSRPERRDQRQLGRSHFR
jgi:hypothetical protein